MYTSDGKRLVNRCLAGLEFAMGSHIVLGYNLPKGTSTSLSSPTSMLNRFHSAYIVDEVQVINSTVMNDDSADSIVFSCEAQPAQRYVANNIALAVIRSNNAQRVRKTLLFGNSLWSDTIPLPNVKFTTEGAVQMEVPTTMCDASFSLRGYGGDDIIAFPFYLDPASRTNYSNDVGASIGFSITYRLPEDTDDKIVYWTYQLNNLSGTTGFDYETVPGVNRIPHGLKSATPFPLPYLFQAKLNEGISVSGGIWSDLLRKDVILKYTTIIAPEDTVFGALQITPDYSVDESRVTVSFRKLNKPLYKTDAETYTNLEYRVGGM